jgi:hypothetical protein
MKYLVAFGRFWWNFIVGDDWTVAAGVAVAIGLVAILVDHGVNAWWLLPLAVVLLTGISVWRQAGQSEEA